MCPFDGLREIVLTLACGSCDASTERAESRRMQVRQVRMSLMDAAWFSKSVTRLSVPGLVHRSVLWGRFQSHKRRHTVVRRPRYGVHHRDRTPP